MLEASLHNILIEKMLCACASWIYTAGPLWQILGEEEIFEYIHTALQCNTKVPVLCVLTG